MENLNQSEPAYPEESPAGPAESTPIPEDIKIAAKNTAYKSIESLPDGDLKNFRWHEAFWAFVNHKFLEREQNRAMQKALPPHSAV